MDKFPEAFRRMEKDVDTEYIKHFNRLIQVTAEWMGDKWKGSPKQIEALMVEAKRLGIPLPKIIYIPQPAYIPPRPPIEYMRVEKETVYLGVKVQTKYGPRWQYPAGTVLYSERYHGYIRVGGRFYRGGPYYALPKPRSG